MAAQTSYDRKLDASYPGMLFDLGSRDTITRTVETAAGIGFGLAVSRGTDKTKQCILGGAAYLGLSLRSLEREADNTAGDIEYKQYAAAAIIRRGYVYCKTAGAVTPGSSVKYVNATGALSTGAAGAGETTIDNATWETTTAADGIGVVRLESAQSTAGA